MNPFACGRICISYSLCIRAIYARDTEKQQRRTTMANSSNKIVVPAARDAMDRFKMEAANEVGVNLKQGYNGDISSRQAGSIGGQMVKNVWPVRLTKNAVIERENRIVDGHRQTVKYIAGIAI